MFFVPSQKISGQPDEEGIFCHPDVYVYTDE